MRTPSLLTLSLMSLISVVTCSNSSSELTTSNPPAAPTPAVECSPNPKPSPAGFDLYVNSDIKIVQAPPDVSNNKPFRTINAAIEEVTRQRKPGGPLAGKNEVWIKVAAGSGYRESVLINESGIRLIGEESQGQKPTILNQSSEIVTIKGGNILVYGLEITNGPDYLTSCPDRDPKDNHCESGSTGISVAPGSKDITIFNNRFHHLGMNYRVACGNDAESARLCWGDSHAISVQSSGALISNVTITENTFSSLHLGTSEGVTINGNVKGFKVIHNTFDHLDNIAIDIAGKWLTCSDGSNPECQAQEGIVANNILSAVYASLTLEDSHFNPGQKDNGKLIMVGAIYVDGGKKVKIDRNTVYNSAVGIDVGSENGARVSDVYVTNNLVYNNRSAGVKLAGEESRVVTTTVANNTLINNNYPSADNGPAYDNGSLYFGGGYVCGIVVANNLISGAKGKTLVTNVAAGPRKCDPAGNKPEENTQKECKLGARCTLQFVSNGFNGDREHFQNDSTWESFRNYYNPQAIEFQDFKLNGFELTASSPARDAGDKSAYPKCDKCCFDRGGRPRIVNNKIDLGAFEFQK